MTSKTLQNAWNIALGVNAVGGEGEEGEGGSTSWLQL
jgi:hypothetical protein